MSKPILFAIALCFSLSAFSQSNAPQFDANMNLAVPIIENEFADSSRADLAAFGFGGGFTTPVLKSPLRCGVSFRYMWLGGDSRTFDEVDDQGYSYELESKVSGSMSPLHLNARFDLIHFTKFPVTPYVGGFVGMRFFGTNNKITVDYEDGSEPTIHNNRQLSVTSSYGYEFGLHVRIVDQLLIDARYEHAYGGWAKYIDLESIEIDDQGEASYSRKNTRTDVSMFTLGITILLE